MLLVHGLGCGGAEMMVCDEARRLRAGRDAVEVGCLGELGELADEIRAEGIPVAFYDRRPGFDRTLPIRLARRLRSGRFDVVHAHQRTALFYALLAGLAAPAPLVYTEHGPPFRQPSRKKKAFNRLLGGRARRITAVAECVKHALVEVECFAPGTIEVVPNGVDCGRFRGGPARTEARTRNGLPVDAPMLGTVGRMEPEKNQALLLHALALLRTRLPNALLAVVGDGAERAALRRLACEIGVADSVRFLGARRDIEAILPSFDVFCLSSRSEGIPLTLLEAMAARVPVVATSAGGIPEAARPDHEAILIPGVPPDCRGSLTNDARRYVERFAAATEHLLRDTTARARLADQAYERVTAAFSLDVVCQRYRQILSDVARGSTTAIE